MAKRKLPPRYKSGPKKGQFKPKSARKRSTRKRSTTTKRRRRRTTARRNPGRTKRTRKRTYRRNPKRMPVVQTFLDGTIEAGQILIGKAAARSIPDMANLPKQGYIGIAVQAGTALLIGYAADMFLSRDASRAMTAGALTAPLETLIVANRIPWLSDALSPVSQVNGLSSYQMGRYSRRPAVSAGNGAATVGRYSRGMGRYSRYQGARG